MFHHDTLPSVSLMYKKALKVFIKDTALIDVLNDRLPSLCCL